VASQYAHSPPVRSGLRAAERTLIAKVRETAATEINPRNEANPGS
jgi:hypothetical protein